VVTYRILVTGERDWPSEEQVHSALAAVIRRLNTSDVVIVHGDCPTGADSFAQSFCVKHRIPVEKHAATNFGSWPGCGPKRNSHMVKLGAWIVCAFWSAKIERSGTFDCLTKAVKAGIRVMIYPRKK
jgi:SLOG family YspA-like protein